MGERRKKGKIMKRGVKQEEEGQVSRESWEGVESHARV
jgi:hypothetical protein